MFYFWMCWVFTATYGLSLVVVRGGCSLVSTVHAILIAWLPLLQSAGPRARGHSSGGAQAQLPHGVWNLPGPETEPVSPALTGELFSTGPPGKSSNHLFDSSFFFFLV